MTDYKNNIAQTERRQVLRDTSTMNSRAIAEAEDVRGRFAQINKSTVIGATSAPNYPAGPNWTHDPTGIEPPLNQDVNAMEPVGELHEIQASLGDEALAPLAEPSTPSGADGVEPASSPPPLRFEIVAPTLRRLIRRLPR